MAIRILPQIDGNVNRFDRPFLCKRRFTGFFLPTAEAAIAVEVTPIVEPALAVAATAEPALAVAATAEPALAVAATVLPTGG